MDLPSRFNKIYGKSIDNDTINRVCKRISSLNNDFRFKDSKSLVLEFRGL